MQTFENAIYQFVACKELCSFAFNSDNQRIITTSIQKKCNNLNSYIYSEEM